MDCMVFDGFGGMVVWVYGYLWGTLVDIINRS